ncbi:bifunctional enoyl-CoA hydratase/phosphate acetyltransferase [Sporomusa acidovorans]|uniref:Phosphate acetyltransferase n=1 Tax=Sporomusa acidovorans (strain ATCC 49682 / DSM 3132 / Mol) TaxID=1123286 RepID=A0ABZ3J7M2_SPOA4|nr:bifunctional enoyl-CoA hydratase/phosphate acetyltransferase [Sporomusa acidovorans]OZC16659.1 phosphate acetyltransferase [Sporomusa acidovorans DSM 3132]SDE07110.1 phosphate butyryltransferase [Sporomusa acidovorans]
MFTDFHCALTWLKDKHIIKKAAVAAAHDIDVLTSVVSARREGILDAVLIGDAGKIRSYLEQLGEKTDQWEIVDEQNEVQAARHTAVLVAEKKVDMPMKGLLQTSTFLKALLDKSLGLIAENGLISQITVFHYPQASRLMLVTDCAINVAPDYSKKLKIMQNAVSLCHKLGIDKPKVAVIAPLELVNPDIQATSDAAMLTLANMRGQIKNCIVDGPLGFDNAVSLAAARHKGIESKVAGYADILLMPDLGAGNILDKSLRYFAGYQTAGVVAGGKVPIIATSRSDSAENKLNSIVLSVLQSL